MIDDTFNKLTYVSLRPLDKGVDRDTPPHLLPVGSFLRLQNVMVRRGGLERRSGYGPFYDGLPSLDWKVYASPLWYDEFGSPVSLLVTKKHLYRVGNGPALTLVSETLHGDPTLLTGTVAAFAGSTDLYTVTDGATTDFTADVEAGDTLWVGGTATGVPYEIVDVNDGSLVFRDHDGSFTIPDPASVDYAVVQGFRRVPDWTVLRQFNGAMYFVWTDNATRGLHRYDGNTVSVIDGETALEEAYPITEIDTVTAFAGRLWIGGMSEDGVDERFRIRWTSVTDQSKFLVANYLDLPVRRYGVSRLLPLGNLLVAYFRDGVYFGRPTNITNLPYDFTPYDTGNIGLVGPRAITSWLDAHWFVGQDDIYSFSASRALERIGTRVVKETINRPGVQLEQTLVIPDPVNERIVFQFYDQSGNVPSLWCYYYKTGAWAEEPFQGQSAYYGRTVNGRTWDDLTGTWDDAQYFAAWYTERPVVAEESLYRSERGALRIYLDGSAVDQTTSTQTPVRVIIESGDFDFDRPNVLKVITQLSVKLEEATPTGVVFEVRAANNRGAAGVSKSLGTLRIPAGSDEGKVDFRMTGSLFRFTLTAETEAAPWLINEIVLVASEVGRESVFV